MSTDREIRAQREPRVEVLPARRALPHVREERDETRGELHATEIREGGFLFVCLVAECTPVVLALPQGFESSRPRDDVMFDVDERLLLGPPIAEEGRVV